MKVLLFTFILCLILLPAAVFSDTITIVADDWCPYNCEPGSDSPGYVVEVAREVFSMAGYSLEYKYVPWARAVREVDKGTYNGAIGASTGDLPTGIFPEEELGFYYKDFIIRKGDVWRFTTVSMR